MKAKLGTKCIICGRLLSRERLKQARLTCSPKHARHYSNLYRHKVLGK